MGWSQQKDMWVCILGHSGTLFLLTFQKARWRHRSTALLESHRSELSWTKHNNRPAASLLGHLAGQAYTIRSPTPGHPGRKRDRDVTCQREKQLHSSIRKPYSSCLHRAEATWIAIYLQTAGVFNLYHALTLTRAGLVRLKYSCRKWEHVK